MDKAAVNKAFARLQKATESLHRAKESKTFKDFSSAWTDLLLAGNSVHSILQQGAKVSPQSRQWFGSKNKFRPKDQLLSYMHQARNSDEHGIAPVIEHTGDTTLIGVGKNGVFSGGSLYIENATFTSNGILGSMIPEEGKSVVIKHKPIVKLATVIDSFRTRFDPPTEHLGIKLVDSAPSAVGALWVTYLQCLLNDAAKLVR